MQNDLAGMRAGPPHVRERIVGEQARLPGLDGHGSAGALTQTMCSRPLTVCCRTKHGSATKTRTRLWAERGSCPDAPHDLRHFWASLLGMACPARDRRRAGSAYSAARACTDLRPAGKYIGSSSP
jgi:integrase